MFAAEGPLQDRVKEIGLPATSATLCITLALQLQSRVCHIRWLMHVLLLQLKGTCRSGHKTDLPARPPTLWTTMHCSCKTGFAHSPFDATIVFAAEGPLQEWAKEKGLSADLPSLCKSEEAGKWMLDQLNVTAKESKLKVTLLIHLLSVPCTDIMIAHSASVAAECPLAQTA